MADESVADRGPQATVDPATAAGDTARVGAELADAFRGVAGATVDQARIAYEKIRAGTEEATDAFEDSYETARVGLVEVQQKAIDALRANADAGLDFARSLLGARTVADMIELQSTFFRSQFEALTSQAQDMQTLVQKVATESSGPVRTALEKALRPGDGK